MDVVLPVVVTIVLVPTNVRVNVQLPDGNPLSVTEPVVTVQVGCVIVPTVGADIAVAGLITTLLVAIEVHPAEFFTVNV